MSQKPENRSRKSYTMKQIMIRCPICNKETQWDGNQFRPFCSERCSLIDLGKWASEEYRIAGEKKETPDADREEKKQKGMEKIQEFSRDKINSNYRLALDFLLEK